MTPDHINCIDCIHFDLRTAPAMAKQGYGVCGKDGRSGRYESATFSRTCRMFEAEPTENSQKRRVWLEAERQRFEEKIMGAA
ncbi:hypothetical protein ACMHYJ_14160 [Castellaniella hirudinis]|uniref:hypothetical protein n=1 Tax=Castellaniella hirudinis TaxID=1144617 RepID=UPI0039C3C312